MAQWWFMASRVVRRNLSLSKTLRAKWNAVYVLLVGTAGFEPATTTPPAWCATRLRYAPKNLNKKKRVYPNIYTECIVYHDLYSIFLSFLPGRNTMVFLGVMRTCSPVLGLRPGRADFCCMIKLPKPYSFTSCCCASASPICWKNASTSVSACCAGSANTSCSTADNSCLVCVLVILTVLVITLSGL